MQLGPIKAETEQELLSASLCIVTIQRIEFLIVGRSGSLRALPQRFLKKSKDR